MYVYLKSIIISDGHAVEFIALETIFLPILSLFVPDRLINVKNSNKQFKTRATAVVNPCATWTSKKGMC